MKLLFKTCEVAGHCLYQSVRHPNRLIAQVSNPTPIQLSAIPWWGSIVIIILGITTWCLASHWSITGLAEAARAMVYIPLGNIFGMSYQMAQKIQRP